MKTSQIWYVVILGKANGPHTEQDVREKLNSGALNFSDLAFRPGLTQWVPLSECVEFERRLDNEFITRTAVELDVPVENIPGWVLLVKHGSFDGRNHYVQSGPYLSEQIRDKLSKGEVTYDDCVWKNGFSTWTVIGTLDEFDRRRPKIYDEQPKPEALSKDDLLAQVPTAIAKDNEATQIQITKEPASEAAIAKEMNQEAAPIPQMKPEGPADGGEGAGTKSHRPSRQKFVIAVAGASLGMLVTFVGIKAYRQYLTQDKSHKSKEMAAIVIPQAPLTVHPVAVNPEIENRIDKKPTTLKIVNLKTAVSGPQLGFETDLPAGSVVVISISAKPGSILKYPSFSLVKKIEVKAGLMPVLDLSAEKLSRGTYNLVAESGALKARSSLPIGNFDDDFKRKLASFKKQVLKQQKSEKEALDDGAKFVTDSITLFFRAPRSANSTAQANTRWLKALKSWNKQYKEESKIFKDVSDAKRNAFAYPEELLKMKELEGRLKDQANIFYQNMKAGRQIASEDTTLPQLRTEMRALREEIKKIQLQ